ncbi:hypothetical protein CMO92_00670 [Candidatus Woesearchaeota archaeon]|nr:hypothetical protein [Candidatus Woesearchaeota archaeon]
MVGFLAPIVEAHRNRGSVWGNTQDGKQPTVSGNGHYGKGYVHGSTNQGKDFRGEYGQGLFVMHYRGKSYSGTYGGGVFAGSGHGRSFNGGYSSPSRRR